MINKLKENWKTALVGGITLIVVLCLCCCDGRSEGPAVIEEAPAVEEVPAEVIE